MFEASVDGEAYDMDKWGQYFKPAGMGQATGDPNKSTSTAAPATAAPAAPVTETATTEAAPAATEAPAESSDSANRAQDILAMIRNRQQQ